MTYLDGPMTLEDRYAALGGRVSYRELCTPAFAVWLRYELLSTPSARQRLLDWAESGGLQSPAPVVPEDLQFYGDTALLPVVAAALEALPTPARVFVLAHAMFLATGRETLGWTGGLPAPLKPRIVLIAGDRSDEQVWRTVLHECGHVWLDPLPTGLRTAAAELDMRAVHTQLDGMADRVAANTGALERRVERLTSLWAAGGFPLAALSPTKDITNEIQNRVRHPRKRRNPHPARRHPGTRKGRTEARRR